MASYPNSYPCPLFHAPICTLLDFSQGDFNFTAFYALYHQFNPGNPPSLQYVRDHWILLVSRLFPDDDDDDSSYGERTGQRGVGNSVAQELRFQAYRAVESSGGQVDVDETVEGPGQRGDSRRRDKNHTEIDGTTKSFEAGMVSLGAEDNTHGAKKAGIGAKSWRSTGVDPASSERSTLRTDVTTGEASAGARSVTTTSKKILVQGKDGGLSSHLHGQGNYNRRRGTRAGRQKRESDLRKLSNSVVNLAFDADLYSNSQIHQTKKTDEMVTTGAPQYHAHDAGKIPSISLPRRRGTRAGRQKREYDLRRLSNSVVNLALDADLISNSQMHQTKPTDEMVTTHVPQSHAHDTDEMPSVSVGKGQGDTVYLRSAPAWQFVDPCSLSQSELDSAITELVRGVQSQMVGMHADRLRLLYRTGWT